MKKLLILFLFVFLSSIVMAQDSTDSKMKVQKIDMRMDNSKFHERATLGGQILVPGLIVGIVGNSVRAENITLTGVGIFCVGLAVLIDSFKFHEKDTKFGFSGNGIKYSIR